MMKQISYTSRGETVFGYAHIPEHAEAAPALILCHGFTGASHEGSRLFVTLANAAAAAGFYVMRINFVGSGDSDADFAEYTTLGGWMEDVRNGVTFLQAQREVNPERIGVLGISFGAGTALACGIDRRIKAVAGWAPVIDTEVVFRGIFGDENWEKLEACAAGKTEETSLRIEHEYAGARFAVTEQFVKDAQTISIPQQVKQYEETELLLMQGDQDTVIDVTRAGRLAQELPFTAEYHLIAGEDHSFMVHMGQNISTTLAFFARTL